MSDAFDELERQLRRAVRTAGQQARRPRRRGWRQTTALVLAAALTVSGGAVAATQLVGGQSAETQGRKLALRAIRETASTPACALVNVPRRLVLSDAAPLPEITAALPALATPASPAVQARALAMLPEGGTADPILRRTARTIAIARGVTLLVYVEQGPGFMSPRDPAACAAERRARAAELEHGRPEAVRRWAEARLAQMRDTAPGLQTLSVMVHARGAASSGGAGIPVVPGVPLRPGPVSGGSLGVARPGAPHPSVYVAIADRRAVRVAVRDRHGHRVGGAAEHVAVHQGFFAVILPAGTGPVHLRELDARGRPVGSVDVRD